MTKQEIIEGNKLIAKFMGLKSITPTYNSSWNFLMPVIDKIELIYDEHHGYFGVHICDLVKTKTVVTKETIEPVAKTIQNSLSFETPFDDKNLKTKDEDSILSFINNAQNMGMTESADTFRDVFEKVKILN